MERGRNAVEDDPDPRSPSLVYCGLKGAKQGQNIIPPDVREGRTGKNRGKRPSVPAVHCFDGTNKWNLVKSGRLPSLATLLCRKAVHGLQPDHWGSAWQRHDIVQVNAGRRIFPR